MHNTGWKNKDKKTCIFQTSIFNYHFREDLEFRETHLKDNTGDNQQIQNIGNCTRQTAIFFYKQTARRLEKKQPKRENLRLKDT